MLPSRIDINPDWHTAPWEQQVVDSQGVIVAVVRFKDIRKKHLVPKYRITWPDRSVTFQQHIPKIQQ